MASRTDATTRAARGKNDPSVTVSGVPLTVSSADSGNILGTVPPGKAGIKLTTGSQSNGTLPGIQAGRINTAWPPIPAAYAPDNFDTTYSNPGE